VRSRANGLATASRLALAINSVNTAQQHIDRKLQDLKTTHASNMSRAKADIDADVATFKAAIDELSAKGQDLRGREMTFRARNQKEQLEEKDLAMRGTTYRRWFTALAVSALASVSLASAGGAADNRNMDDEQHHRHVRADGRRSDRRASRRGVVGARRGRRAHRVARTQGAHERGGRVITLAPDVHRQAALLDVDLNSSLVDDRFTYLPSARQRLKTMNGRWQMPAVHRLLLASHGPRRGCLEKR
jgi:hypothetical protein